MRFVKIGTGFIVRNNKTVWKEALSLHQYRHGNKMTDR